MQYTETKPKNDVGFLGIILFVLMLGVAIRSWQGSNYTQNRLIVYPVLIMCFQYGAIIYLMFGVLLVLVSVIRLKQIGCVLSLLALSIYIVIGILQVFVTYPALEHMASVRFNNRTYNIVSDTRYEEDSLAVPTTYLLFECDALGIQCIRSQLLFHDKLQDKNNDFQRIERKAEFVINDEEKSLYAKIDDQIFPVLVGKVSN